MEEARDAQRGRGECYAQGGVWADEEVLVCSLVLYLMLMRGERQAYVLEHTW